LATELIPLLEQHDCTEFAAFLLHATRPEPAGTGVEDDIDFGLDRILDGIGTLVAR
jgi:hypothetical protein